MITRELREKASVCLTKVKGSSFVRIFLCMAFLTTCFEAFADNECTRTSRVQARSCKNEVREEYWNAIGNCLNISSLSERHKCRREAAQARRQARIECFAKFDAREDVGTLKTRRTESVEFQSELDSHADTCVVGAETVLEIHDYGRPVRVLGYDLCSSQNNDCRTVTAVIAYDHPETGETFMLVINQAILILCMKANLLGMMQLCDNDLRVNDKLKCMALTPMDDTHVVIVPPPVKDDDPLHIPLSLKGVTLYFPTRKPTKREYESTPENMIFELTADSPEWDPSSTHFKEQEDALLDSSGKLIEKPAEMTAKRIFAALTTILQQEPTDNLFGVALEGTVLVKEWQMKSKSVSARAKREACVRSVKALQTSKRKNAITPAMLAKNWGIGLQTVQRTIEATLQQDIRTSLHPTLSRRFRTNDRQLRY